MTQATQATIFGNQGQAQSFVIPQRSNRDSLSRTPKIAPPSNEAATTYVHQGHLNLDTFSPVSQNGSFAFDRVIKSGTVLKRTRKTKKWKSVFLVLRPNLLSIYRNSKEDKLRKQLNPSDLTAVACLKDPKREHVFGLFSPSRNFHFEAPSEREARVWIELIRREARIGEEEEEMYLATSGGHEDTHRADGRRGTLTKPTPNGNDHGLGSSSPEPHDLVPSSFRTRDGVQIPILPGRASHSLEYSGNELGSDFSDAPEATSNVQSTVSISLPKSAADPPDLQPPPSSPFPSLPATTRPALLHDDERVLRHGFLFLLKSKPPVRTWRYLWAVLRPKTLAFYKNEDEYAAVLLIPLSSVVDAVEIDPISRSKKHCMQIIAEEKSYRLSAMDEEGLARWLGGLKSLVRRREDVERREERFLGKGKEIAVMGTRSNM